MPKIPNQLTHPEVQPRDDGSNANDVGVSPQPLAVPYQPQQPPYAQPPTSQPFQLGTSQQQWQQPTPLPQYDQQPPRYQPPMLPPQVAPKKPKSRKRLLWLIIGVAVLIVIVGAMSQAGKGQPTTSQATQPASTSQSSQPTAKPTQPSRNTIGNAVQVGDTWIVTVNSVTTSPGSDFTKPKSGNIFVVVDVTVKNISSSNQAVSSIIMFNLRDATGQQYTETFAAFAKPAPDGTVTPNSLLRGQLVYEVPSTDHTFTFSYQSGLTGSDIAEWNVTV